MRNKKVDEMNAATSYLSLFTFLVLFMRVGCAFTKWGMEC